MTAMIVTLGVAGLTCWIWWEHDQRAERLQNAMRNLDGMMMSRKYLEHHSEYWAFDPAVVDRMAVIALTAEDARAWRLLEVLRQAKVAPATLCLFLEVRLKGWESGEPVDWVSLAAAVVGSGAHRDPGVRVCVAQFMADCASADVRGSRHAIGVLLRLMVDAGEDIAWLQAVAKDGPAWVEGTLEEVLHKRGR